MHNPAATAMCRVAGMPIAHVQSIGLRHRREHLGVDIFDDRDWRRSNWRAILRRYSLKVLFVAEICDIRAARAVRAARAARAAPAARAVRAARAARAVR